MEDEGQKVVKHIASLDIDLNKANKQLQDLSNTLNSFSEDAESKLKKVGDSINQNINSFDITSINKYLSEIDKSTAKAITKHSMKMQELSKKIELEGSKRETATNNSNLKIEAIEAKSNAKISAIQEAGSQKRLSVTTAEKAKQETAIVKSNLKIEQEEARSDAKRLSQTKDFFQNAFAVGTGITSANIAFQALRNSAVETVKEMENVEFRMMEISRIMADGSINVKDYRDSLIELASEYGRSFDDVSNATLNFARAGFNAQESLKLTKQSMLALNTAELDANQATDGLIAVMAQWGLNTGNATEEAENLGAVIDKINKVADNFPIESKDILEALQRTSQGFALTGASIDETIAMIVAAEKESQRGGKIIGTAMSNMAQQLKAEGKLDLAEQLGINFYKDDTKTEFKSITGIFEEMSKRMAQLKEEGKENSVEMQNLLELFTVFRRNIGAGLLSEMGGEESTYAKALETSLNSVGYSAQENSKYMSTMTAQSQSLKDELLKLKTEVWDGGLEDVVKGFISLSGDVITSLNKMIDEFGAFPVAISAITTAFNVLNKNVSLEGIEGMKAKISDARKAIEAYNLSATDTSNSAARVRSGAQAIGESFSNMANSTTKARKGAQELNESFKTGDINGYLKTVEKGSASLTDFAAKTAIATVKDIALTVAHTALNAVISFGASLIVSALVAALSKWINKQDEVIKKNKELKEQSEENAAQYGDESESIQNLAIEYQDAIKEYENLKKTKQDTGNAESKLFDIQSKLNEKLKESGQQIDIIKVNTDKYGKSVADVNEKYQEQLSKIQQIAYEKKKQEVSELQNDIDYTNKTSAVEMSSQNRRRLSATFVNDPSKADLVKDIEKFNKLGLTNQIEVLHKAQQGLAEYASKGRDVRDFLKIINETFEETNEKIKDVNTATDKYNESVRELYDTFGLKAPISDFKDTLDAISKTYNSEGPKKMIRDLQSANAAFLEGKTSSKQYFDSINNEISKLDSKSIKNAIDIVKESTRENVDEIQEQQAINVSEIEEYQAIVASTSEMLAESFSVLQTQLKDSEITFEDYMLGMEGAGESALELYTKTNDLSLNESGHWEDASHHVDEYADSLQNAISSLSSYNDIINVISDNHEILEGHINNLGQLALTTEDIASGAFTGFANSFIDSLNSMRDQAPSIFQDIVNTASQAAGISSDAFLDANGNITYALGQNASTLNAFVNTSTTGVGQALGKLTTSAGKIISSLGEAIENFSYQITLEPSLDNLDVNLGNLVSGNGPILSGKSTIKVSGSSAEGNGVANLANNIKAFGQELESSAPISISVGDILAHTVTSSNRNKYPRGSIPSLSSSSTPSSSRGSSGSGSSHTPSSYSSSTTERNTILQDFKDSISERESDEQRWVKKQKELNQLSSNDQKYILQEEIKRYKKYADEVMQLAGVTEEEKLKARKEYLNKAEDLELNYIDVLEDELKEQTEKIKKQYDERIDKIKETADKEIDALKKVEDTNDRIRDKEEYYRKREEIIHGNEGIEYWEQRTGRSAQLALADAKKKLEDLDREWKEKQEGWTTDDQIEAIEKRRDADIKATEDQMNAEINALQEAYDYRVKAFAETGNLIYDQATIQSRNLYNNYKSNFIDPVGSELQKALSQQQTSSAPASSTTDYTIQWGDTLTGIANRFGTSIEKIMSANPSITDKNRIYAGKTLKIPKSHTGSRVIEDGLVELQKGEIVLNTKWARDLDRMLDLYTGKAQSNKTVNNGNTVNVKGDMVKIEAKIEDKSDINALARKVSKNIEKKFDLK